MTAICIELGWDYYTYMSQPSWFIDSIKLYYKQRATEIKKMNAKMKVRGNR